MNRWEDADPKALEKFHCSMRHILDRTDLKEIKDCLVKYTETIEILNARIPGMGCEKADWALAMAVAPDWYGDGLSGRLQNSMLVSALLLTVTATLFVEPPMGDSKSADFRVFVYLCGLCNMLFILSIMVGIFFIENAMSRAYCPSERFVLIIRYYFYKDISQVLMAIGAALFPIVLGVPMWANYVHVDADILIAFIALYVVFTIWVMSITTAGAKAEQVRRLALFSKLLDPVTFRIKPEFYPPDADMKLSDYEDMYRETEISSAL